MTRTAPSRRLAQAAILALLAAVAACAGVSVSTARSPDADFSGRTTYAWAPNPQMGGAMDRSITGQQVHADVDAALAAHGFRPADGQPPDLLVDYRVVMQRQVDLEGGPGWGGLQTVRYEEGTFILLLLDPASQNVLWRGVARDTVDAAGGGEGQVIEEAVQKMFLKFPN